MDEVKDVMTSTVQTISPAATLAEAAALMGELEVGALVVQEGEHLVGMLTDRDITVRAAAKGLNPAHTLVRDAMTEGVVYCREDQTTKEAAAIMQDYHIRRLPVLNSDHHLAGIVTLDDLATDGGGKGLAGTVLASVAQRPKPRTPSYKHIVVALDGSEEAEQILPYVEPLAEQFGSKITLLRAVTPFEEILTEAHEERVPEVVGSHGISMVAPITPEARVDAARYLTAIKERLESKGITVECDYPDAPPHAAIVRRARHTGADLIAMATHNRGWLNRALEGSVADEVIHRAPCAVLVVRADESDR